MKRLLLVPLALLVVAAGPARAADPSAACDTGLLPASSTPAGVGLRASSEPGTATLTACLATGPLPGHVRVKGDAAGSALVIVDGDPSATMLGCSDGYTAAGVNGDGLSLYHAPDGGFTSRARAKSASEIADSAMKNCTLATG